MVIGRERHAGEERQHDAIPGGPRIISMLAFCLKPPVLVACPTPIRPAARVKTQSAPIARRKRGEELALIEVVERLRGQ
jgi:hypothetical protein